MLNIHLQDGGSSGIRLFPNCQTPTALSCYLVAPMGLNRIPTLFMDRRTQQDMCAELQEEIQCFTLGIVNLSSSGLEVGLFRLIVSFSLSPKPLNTGFISNGVYSLVLLLLHKGLLCYFYINQFPPKWNYTITFIITTHYLALNSSFINHCSNMNTL